MILKPVRRSNELEAILITTQELVQKYIDSNEDNGEGIIKSIQNEILPSAKMKLSPSDYRLFCIECVRLFKQIRANKPTE
jgi:hypothetical protein